MLKRILLPAVLAASLTVPAVAHHGQEFLLVQDAATPLPFSGTLYSGMDWAKFGSQDSFAVEPGFLLGVFPRLAVGASAEFSDSGNGWRYESVSPYFQLSLTPAKSPVRVAMQAGYAFVDRQHPEVYRSTTTNIRPASGNRSTSRRAPAAAPSTGGTDPPDDPPLQCGPDYGPDAPPCPCDCSPAPANDSSRRTAKHAGHVRVKPAPVSQKSAPASRRPPGGNRDQVITTTTKTIHAPEYRGLYPDENHFFTRLIVEADLTARDKVILNLIGIHPEDGAPAWGYAAGLEHSFSHEWAVGVEAIGDFTGADEHEIVLGGYFSPFHSTTFKLGMGCGLTDASPDLSVHAGMVWRF